MDEAKFVIHTRMEKADYRKFLYLATFFRRKIVIPLLLIISLAGSLWISLILQKINIITIVIVWLFLSLLCIAVILFKVERRNRQRIKTDNTGIFDSENVLTFYEDRMVMENPALKSTAELAYEKFYGVMDSKEYFIFYLNVNQASLIRKKDVTSLVAFEEFLRKKFGERFQAMPYGV